MQILIKHKQLEDADLTDALFKEMQSQFVLAVLFICIFKLVRRLSELR
jgi:hypothetical protein